MIQTDDLLVKVSTPIHFIIISYFSTVKNHLQLTHYSYSIQEWNGTKNGTQNQKIH